MNNEAVSPVVGVMLMLVVTIIIAAVVSAFAGGMAGDEQAAPSASIEVTIGYDPTLGMSGEGGYNMEFKHLSGDYIPTKDLAIITYYTNETGYTYKHEQTASSGMTDLYGDEWGYGVRYYARVPYLNDMRYGYAGGSYGSGNPDVDFGNYTWKVGDVLCTNGDPATADLLGINDDSDPHQIEDPDFGTGSVVDVKILHIPSGKYIYDKEVVVL